MGKKSSPAPPATPDYNAAAQAQGTANLEAARTNAQLTNTNQVTPYGNQTFTKDPNSDQWTSTISLSPEQKSLYDNYVSGQQTLGADANSMLGRVGDATSQPMDTSNLPARVNSVGTPDYSMYTANGQLPNSSLNLKDYGGDPTAAQSSLDFSAAGKAPTMQDFKDQGQQVQDALYHQATANLDPQWQQQQESERSRLLNSGATEGSEAYNNAMDSFNRNRTAAYGDARDRSIAAGVNASSTMSGDALASRAQMLSQILNGGNFANSAKQQTFNNTNLLTGANNQNATDSANFGNSVAQKNFDNLNTITGANNTVQAQKFNNDLTAGNFQNQNRASAMDEAAYLRSQPLNEYNSLITGAQVTNPNFRQTGQVAPAAAAPVFAGAQAQGQNALDLYNQQMASANSASSGITGLLGKGLTAAAAFSDRRLKTNIKPVGEWGNTGLTKYSYEIFGRPMTGVMSDEVRLKYPEAVISNEWTYDTVDYSKLAEAA